MTETPLHKAAANNHVEILKFLLEWQGEEKAELEAKNMVILCFPACPPLLCIPMQKSWLIIRSILNV